MTPAEHVRKVLKGTATENERKELKAWLDTQLKTESKDVELPVAEQLCEYPSLSAKFVLHSTHQKRRKAKRAVLVLSVALVVILVNLSIIVFLSPSATPQARFEHATLAQVVSYLQAQYQITINVNDSKLLQCRLTCTFYRARDIEELVKQVAATVRAESRRTANGTFIINGVGC